MRILHMTDWHLGDRFRSTATNAILFLVLNEIGLIFGAESGNIRPDVSGEDSNGGES
jgi:hypothetical protein